MAILFNGAEIAPNIVNQQPTDFSKVTARPEFVAAGKYFYDEKGQLQVGTSKYIHKDKEITGVIVTGDNISVSGNTLIIE